MSQEIKQQSQKLAKARNLAKRVHDPANPLKLHHLTYQDRNLLEEFRSGLLEDDSRRLQERQAELQRAATRTTKHHSNCATEQHKEKLPQKRKR